MENSIHYVHGDATRPVVEGNKVIVHICNDRGGWGKGFVLSISNRWPEPEAEYRKWFQSGQGFALGAVQYVRVAPDTWVANIIGQHGMNKDEAGNPPIRYDAVLRGLFSVEEFAHEHGASVHMPRIGCGLAGGTWAKMEPVIEQALTINGVNVTVYDF